MKKTTYEKAKDYILKHGEQAAYYCLGRMSVFWGEKEEKNIQKYWEIRKGTELLDCGAFWKPEETKGGENDK